MSELFIETRGRGERQLVLIHGWAMHGGVFAPLVDALTEHCTLHIVDLPGHGHSRDCDLPLQPEACARAIAAATPPATWLGWSLGGLVALTAALDMPAQVQGLAMLCASPCFVRRADWPLGVEAEVFAQFGRDLEHDYRATLERFLALEALGSEHAREEMRQLRGDVFARGEPDPRVLQEGIALLQHTDLREEVATLTQPSCWIAGARDRLIPWQAMAWSTEACGGRFARIPHAGHAPFIGFADAVAAALDSDTVTLA
ncbi:MAG TPA: pimeloyl-ACP methyl ester esterase BioH [Rhodanobacteraceae bacterium]|nr:pimeloyl-ACP methyl ester esterase BioH [Rhodanobacteraceae bacterium]